MLNKTITHTLWPILSLVLIGCNVYDLPVPPECLPDPSLIGEWKFEEQSGIEVIDSYGGKEGVLERGTSGVYPQWVEDGISGGGLYFNGSESYVRWDNEPVFDFGTQSFSLEMWIQADDPSADGGNMQTIFGDFHGYPLYSITLDGAGRLATRIAFSQANDSTVNDGILLVENKWYHIVVVFDRSFQNIKRFVDGKKYGSDHQIDSTVSLEKDSRGVAIGAQYTSVGTGIFPYKGKIDEFRVHARALTEDEITLRYGATTCFERL